MANKYAPKHGGQWFREEYIEKGRSMRDIGEELGLGRHAVSDRLKSYGIESRDRTPYEQLNDRDYLERQYVDNRMTAREIADDVGCSRHGVYNALERFDIERRTVRDYAASRPAEFFMLKRGHEYWRSRDEYVAVHRLLAVAHHGFDAVCDMDVHHKNGVPWDNRPENIELLTHSEHSRIHSLES